MNLTKDAVAAMFRGAAAELAGHVEELSEIDSRFGDGDHGVTVGKIARLIEQQADGWGDRGLKQWFEDLGTAVMGVSGGSAGPLYGTLLGGFAVPLEEDTAAVDAPLLKQMFAGVLSEMEDITTAKVGDKTMMDALIPAVAAAQEAPDEVSAILLAAAAAAEQGAKASEQYVSKFGRARSYKEQTIGTPDAGAVSTSLLLRGLARAFD